jgi:hypothetical protein
MSLTDTLKDLAPALATALGGPLAGLAVGFIAKQFGVDPDKIADVVQGADPVKMKELDDNFKMYMANLGISLQLAQIQVNTEEAKSTNWLVAGWRPAVGWVGAFSLAYAAIIEPVARFTANVMYHYAGAFPIIDINLTMQVLMGLLGLGAMRTYEKSKGAEGNR